MNKTNRMRAIVAGLFGLCVIASGLWRYLGAEGGHTGLWFGIIMGGMALVGCGLFTAGKSLPANVLTWTSILFVSGWFIFEAFGKKGLVNAEPRQLIIIVISAVAAAEMVIVGVKVPTTKEALDAESDPPN